MNSKQCAKLAFGNPGFFDFLAPVTNFLRPVTTPLVQAATSISAPIVQAITGGSPAVSRAFQGPEAQKVGQDLAAIGIVTGGAIGAGAVAAPLLAGVALPSLGSLTGLGSSVVNNPDVTDFLMGDSEDDSDIFSDIFDEDDPGPDEE